MSGFIKKIEQINFGLMSPEDIREMSVVTVETPDTYEDDGFPIEKGLMDPRLGVIDPSLVCRTCGFRGGDCQGHFGSIELARPVIHVGFGDDIYKILIFKKCVVKHFHFSEVCLSWNIHFSNTEHLKLIRCGQYVKHCSFTPTCFFELTTVSL